MTLAISKELKFLVGQGFHLKLTRMGKNPPLTNPPLTPSRRGTEGSKES